MVLIIFVIIKLVFSYFLYKLYLSFRKNSIDLHSLELISKNSRKQTKLLYLVLGIAIFIVTLGAKGYDKWQEKKKLAEIEEMALLEEWEEDLDLEEEQEEEVKIEDFSCLDEEFSFTGNGSLNFYNKRGNRYDVSGVLERTPFKGKVLFETENFRIVSGNIKGIIDVTDDCKEVRGMIKVKDDYGYWKSCLLNHTRRN